MNTTKQLESERDVQRKDRAELTQDALTNITDSIDQRYGCTKDQIAKQLQKELEAQQNQS